jgi:hypothetical protein
MTTELTKRQLIGMVGAAMLLVAAACVVPLVDSAIYAARRVYNLLSKDAVADVPKGLKSHRMQAGVPRKDGWYDAKSTEGHFRVSLPIPFNDATIEPDEKNAGIGYMIGSTSAEGLKFVALEWVDLKKRETKEALKAIPESFREKGGWKVSRDSSNTRIARPLSSKSTVHSARDGCDTSSSPTGFTPSLSSIRPGRTIKRGRTLWAFSSRLG